MVAFLTVRRRLSPLSPPALSVVSPPAAPPALQHLAKLRLADGRGGPSDPGPAGEVPPGFRHQSRRYLRYRKSSSFSSPRPQPPTGRWSTPPPSLTVGTPRGVSKVSGGTKAPCLICGRFPVPRRLRRHVRNPHRVGGVPGEADGAAASDGQSGEGGAARGGGCVRTAWTVQCSPCASAPPRNTRSAGSGAHCCPRHVGVGHRVRERRFGSACRWCVLSATCCAHTQPTWHTRAVPGQSVAGDSRVCSEHCSRFGALQAHGVSEWRSPRPVLVRKGRRSPPFRPGKERVACLKGVVVGWGQSLFQAG